MIWGHQQPMIGIARWILGERPVIPCTVSNSKGWYPAYQAVIPWAVSKSKGWPGYQAGEPDEECTMWGHQQPMIDRFFPNVQ